MDRTRKADYRDAVGTEVHAVRPPARWGGLVIDNCPPTQKGHLAGLFFSAVVQQVRSNIAKGGGAVTPGFGCNLALEISLFDGFGVLNILGSGQALRGTDDVQRTPRLRLLKLVTAQGTRRSSA